MFKIFRIFYEKWKKLALRIAVFQSKVLLTIFYFTFLAPFGIILSFFKDELKIKISYLTTWVNKENSPDTIEKLKHQY